MRLMITLLSVAALLTMAVHAQVDLGEDFNGSWGSANDLDIPTGSKTILTPQQDADNQSLGDWTGFTPADDNSLYLNNSTSFGADGGSGYRALTADVASGFLVFGATASDETGAYAYTGPFGPIDLSGDARIEFDSTITGLNEAPSAIAIRLMLRVPNSPSPPSEAWIISEPVSLDSVAVTPSIFAKPANWASPRLSGVGSTPAISVRPDELSWQAFSVPDAELVPLSTSPEQAGVPVGGEIPSFVISGAILPTVTGVGIHFDSDISAGSFGGVWIDALHLRDAVSIPVELSIFSSR